MPLPLKPTALLKYLKDNQITFLDFRFTDLRGQWRSISYPTSTLSINDLQKGIPLPSFAEYNPSDILEDISSRELWLIPDLTIPQVEDPFALEPTAILFCYLTDKLSSQPFSYDARTIAQKTEVYFLKHLYRVE